MSNYNFRPEPFPELPQLSSEQSLAFHEQMSGLRSRLDFELELSNGMPVAQERWAAEEEAALRKQYLLANAREAARVVLPIAASAILLKFYAK